MATGDQADCLARIRSTLPRWFGDTSQSPTLNAVLTGIAAALSFLYGIYAYAKLQTRIKTATDGWLDMIAGDWFGAALQRRAGQTDASYRALIIAWIFRERVTRAALVKVLTDVTGRAPMLLEPNRPLDTGGYGVPYAGYNVAGGYGAVGSIPANAMFVIAYRPLAGSDQYGVQDSDIYAAVEAVRPVGVTIWVQISN